MPATFEWPDGIRAAAIITVDVDAESGILTDHPQTAAHLNVVAHQAYEALSGVPRLMRIFERQAVPATFFVPGFTADRWPDLIRTIRDAGHEIGHHGYQHEPVHGVDEATERDYLVRGLDALERVAGVRPMGYRAPKFKLNFRSPRLLVEHGFRYDSSLMDSDVPYRLAAGPEPDAPTLIEMPVQWALDDWSQFAFMPGLLPGTTIESPSKALDLWTLELEASAAEGACFMLTLHPYLSGRPSRAHAIEQLIERMKSIKGLWIATAGDVAEHSAALHLPARWHRPLPGTDD